ncbi:MAG TPA: VOC family protein [Streptosporangiaceae bacterium]
MCWGTAIEAPDPSALAKFYAELLGWHIGHEEPGTAIVAVSPQGPFFVFQRADGVGSRGRTWPYGDACVSLWSRAGVFRGSVRPRCV